MKGYIIDRIKESIVDPECDKFYWYLRKVFESDNTDELQNLFDVVRHYKLESLFIPKVLYLNLTRDKFKPKSKTTLTSFTMAMMGLFNPNIFNPRLCTSYFFKLSKECVEMFNVHLLDDIKEEEIIWNQGDDNIKELVDITRRTHFSVLMAKRNAKRLNGVSDKINELNTNVEGDLVIFIKEIINAYFSGLGTEPSDIQEQDLYHHDTFTDSITNTIKNIMIGYLNKMLDLYYYNPYYMNNVINNIVDEVRWAIEAKLDIYQKSCYTDVDLRYAITFFLTNSMYNIYFYFNAGIKNNVLSRERLMVFNTFLSYSHFIMKNSYAFKDKGGFIDNISFKRKLKIILNEENDVQ